LFAAVLFASPLAAQHTGHQPLPHADCTPPALLARIQARIAAFASRLPPGPDTSPLDSYRFLPIAGNQWDDLHTYNFVDLDPTAGISDHECTNWTYNTHRGHDVHIGGFAEMDLGVPVFAVLPGIVVDAHDGEPDRNTWPNSLPSNFVILWHGGTHYTWYLHLRRLSVAVAIGERVAGGQQIGQVGSSGNSSWPHLHFESWNDNAHYEPNSGPCRPGASNWTNQIPRRTGVWISDFAVGPGDFHLQAPLPEDYNRQATWGLGWNYIGFWFQYQNLPVGATARVRWLRPDNSVAIDSGSGRFGSGFSRWDWVWFRWWVNCNQIGTWNIELSISNQVVATMPFDVVANPSPPLSRPPEPLVGAVFEPVAPVPGDVLFCRAQTALLRDRDYDVVRYRYEWRRNGAVLRDVTHAGRADCLPDGSLRPGDVIQCTITPKDGVSNGLPTVRTVTVGSGPALVLSLRGAGHVGGTGKPMAVAPGPRDVSFVPGVGAFPVFGLSFSPCGTGFPLGQSPPCALPAGVVLFDLVSSPLLTTSAATFTMPPGIAWQFCVQAVELVPVPGGLCLEFTNAYHLAVNY
jgi:hypothetical protein